MRSSVRLVLQFPGISERAVQAAWIHRGSVEQNTRSCLVHMAVSFFSDSERESGAAMVAAPFDQAGGAGKSEGVAAAW